MKIKFNFDTEERSFTLTPEDELEQNIMEHIEKQCTKGSRLTINAIEDKKDFKITMRVNGK